MVAIAILLINVLINVADVAYAITIIRYQVATTDSEPGRITTGPDGNLWFVDFQGQIGRATPTGTITEYPLPTSGVGPNSITAGPDGNVWFTEQLGNQIGKITLAGTVSEYPIPTAASVPVGITAGADGNLWFLEYSAMQIGKATPTGTIVEYRLPNFSLDSIASGSDGNVWFTSASSICSTPDEDGCDTCTTVGYIDKITPTGVITEYQLPTLGVTPQYIASGPDGNLWFTGLQCDDPDADDCFSSEIGKITPAGTITEYSLLPGRRLLTAITGGPDGNVWFAGSAPGAEIGKMTPRGAISDYLLGQGDPVGITTGPDGNIWFTDEIQISRVVLCLGDCNGSHSVTIDELLTMVDIALGTLPATDCNLAGSRVTINQIISAVGNSFNGCSD